MAQGHRQGLKGAVPPTQAQSLVGPLEWLLPRVPPAACQFMAQLPSDAQGALMPLPWTGPAACTPEKQGACQPPIRPPAGFLLPEFSWLRGALGLRQRAARGQGGLQAEQEAQPSARKSTPSWGQRPKKDEAPGCDCSLAVDKEARQE